MHTRSSRIFVWGAYLALPVAYLVFVAWAFNQGAVEFAAVLLGTLAVLGYELVRRAPYNPEKLEGFL